MPGYTVEETEGSTEVDESETTDTFTVVLDAQPASDEAFTIASEDIGEASLDLASINFTPADWNVPQTITVTGVNDGSTHRWRPDNQHYRKRR